MAKSYIDIVKYMVEARFEIFGLVDKPDIIGAVFGQTEGLLGSDLDLRELQKNGKIGRIEIDTTATGNRTNGRLHLPSSLGRVETCILAAAIESVDRVGPFETTFKIEKVEDTRSEKRRKIVNRAKELVKSMLTTGTPDSRELSELVETEVKSSEVTTYGPELLPAGPDIDINDDIILVEGRADVVNLLKNDITNCVAVGGAAGTIPKTIIALCAAKETTLFLDGDRGGDIILKGLVNAAEIDFVARAPDGKEVEELARKEIIKSLRSRVPIEQIVSGKGKPAASTSTSASVPQQQQRPAPLPDPARQPRQFQRPMQQNSNARPMPQQQQRPQPPPMQQREAPRGEILSPSDIVSNLSSHGRKEPIQESNQPDIRGIDDDQNPIDSIKDISEGQPGAGPLASPMKDTVFLPALDELHNTLRGRLYSKDGKGISEVPIRELIQAVQETPNLYAVVFDGIITQRLIELAYKAGAREIYGIRASQVTRKFDDMLLYTKEHGKL